jgi:hypothetical protein
MSTNVARLLYWLPRVLGLLYAGFISMFAADVFGEQPGFWRTTLALLVHLIPTAIVLVVLAIGWRWNLVGAAGFIALGLLYTVRFSNHPDWILFIAGPTFVIGFLFLLNWLGMRRVTK